MEQVTQRTAASAEESAAASEQLARDVDTSREVVRELERLVGESATRRHVAEVTSRSAPALRRAA